MIIKEGMIIKIWLSNGKESLKFTGEVLGVDSSFIEIRDEHNSERRFVGINNITNIELIKEENEQNEQTKNQVRRSN